MEFSDISNNIEAMTEELAKVKEKYQVEMRKNFTELTSAFFTKYPEIKYVQWNQYVPGFNDGSPCEFTISDIYFSLSDQREDYLEDMLYTDEEGQDFILDLEVDRNIEWRKKYSPKYDAEIVALEAQKAKYGHIIEDAKKFEKAIHQNEDLMETMFGSDARVTLSTSGVEVEEYDCGY